MKKYLRRLSARLARTALRESAKQGKDWIVSKKLILETEEGDLEFEKGDMVEIGATPEGDMALNGSAAVVVVADPELAAKIADVVVSSDELSDVKFVDKPALDAVLDGEEVDSVIDKLADEDEEKADDEEEKADADKETLDADELLDAELEDTEETVPEVEVAELDIEQKESVESKFDKFSNHRMNPLHFLQCESILVDEEDTAPINIATLKSNSVLRESISDYKTFAQRVSERHGSLQPGKKEFALSENGKYIGMFDKAANMGILFTEEEFETSDEMLNKKLDPKKLEQDFEKELDQKMPDDSMPFEYNEDPELLAAIDDLSEEDLALLNDVQAQYDDEDFQGDIYQIANEKFENSDALQDLLSTYDLVTVLDARANHEEVDTEYLDDTLFNAEDLDDSLGMFEESAKTGADYRCLTESLQKMHLTEACIAKIVETFDNKSLKECVRVFDSRYGKYVAAFKESVDADNFIEETKEAKHFTKRFFN